MLNIETNPTILPFDRPSMPINNETTIQIVSQQLRSTSRETPSISLLRTRPVEPIGGIPNDRLSPSLPKNIHQELSLMAPNGKYGPWLRRCLIEVAYRGTLSGQMLCYRKPDLGKQVRTRLVIEMTSVEKAYVIAHASLSQLTVPEYIAVVILKKFQ